MKITKEELKNKYGIDLPKGQYRITKNGNKYEISEIKSDSEGCILVGEYLSRDWIKNSQTTLGKLIKLMTNEKNIDICIINANDQLQK